MMGIGMAVRPPRQSLTHQALAAIRRAGGTVFLSGLPRNYFDSAGTTPATVDNPVGLVLDGAGTVGPERRQDFVTGVGGTATAATYDTGTGAGSVTRVDLSNQSFVRITGLTASKSYQLSITNTGAVAVNIRQLDYAGSTVATVAAGASGECVFTGNANCVITAAGGTATFTLNEFRELTGNHASQPTTGSKPTLRRGLVNQLLWSGDFTNAAWTKTNASPLVGQLDPYGGTSAVKLVESAATGAHYFLQSAVSGSGTATAAWVVKAAGRTKIKARSEGPQTSALSTTFNLSSGTVVTGTGSILPLGNDFFLCVANSAGNGNGASGYHLLQPLDDSYAESYAGDGTSGVIFYRAALYQGTVTAQQILAAGGIQLTTTAPASSALGNYWWQFDPAAPGDYLQTAITTGNEGWVCAGVTFGGAAAANETVFASGAGSANQKGVWLLRNGSSTALRMGVGNGTSLTMDTVTALPLLNVPRVVEGGWDASNVYVGVDGITSSKAKTGDVTAPATALVGAFLGGILPLQGSMPAIVICPTLPPSADRALIRAWVAKQQGQTL